MIIIVRLNLHHGLFALRSAGIAWRAGFGEGEPWNRHHLVLFCMVNIRLWTAEGTAQVYQEKVTVINKIIKCTKAKGQLNQVKEAFLRCRETTLALLNNPSPVPVSHFIKVILRGYLG